MSAKSGLMHDQAKPIMFRGKKIGSNHDIAPGLFVTNNRGGIVTHLHRLSAVKTDLTLLRIS